MLEEENDSNNEIILESNPIGRSLFPYVYISLEFTTTF